MQDDLKAILKACVKNEHTTVALFGSYAKAEGFIMDGKPVNDLDLIVVDAKERQKARFTAVRTSVPLDIIYVTSQELAQLPITQMWWEIAYANETLSGEPLRLPKLPPWEIPYWDAIESINKRIVSLIIGKHEMMKETPDWLKVRTQIGKMIIALGDAVLIKRGQFDHRYAVRSHMLMHDDIGNLYRLAVSWKLLDWPETDPDQLWSIWGDVKQRTIDYITHQQIGVPNKEPLLEITETTTQEQVAQIITILGGQKWL